MATIAKHVDNYTRYYAQACVALDELTDDNCQVNWRIYDRAYDRMMAAARVLLDLGIDVDRYLALPDPHTL